MKKSLLFFITLVFVASFFCVSYESELAVAAGPTGELRIGLGSLFDQKFYPFRSLDSNKIYTTVMYDFLVGVDAAGNLEPGVAYKWEESADHRVWTLYIRNDVKFHDGSPLTLDDVKFSIEDILEEKNVNGKSIWAPYLDRVETRAPGKVVVYLKKPFNTFLYSLSNASVGTGIILPEKYLKEKGVDYFNKQPIGTGPYRFLESKEGEYIKFEALEKHWRVGVPGYKHMTFKSIPEEGTRIAALKKNEVDVIPISLQRINEVEKGGLNIILRKAAIELSLWFIGVGEKGNPMDNLKVRQAMAYAINREEIAKGIFNGRSEPIGHSFYMTKDSIGFDPSIPVTPYDPVKAKQLLTEAGYPKGFTHYHFNHHPEIPEISQMCEVLASYWSKIGLDVKILVMEPTAYMAIYSRKNPAPGPATVIMNQPATVTARWRMLFHSDYKVNMFSRFGDATSDKLIDEFEAALDEKDYIRTNRALEKYVRENFWVNGLVDMGVPWGTAKNVPTWNPGKDLNKSYRFEYIGAHK